MADPSDGALGNDGGFSVPVVLEQEKKKSTCCGGLEVV